MSELRIDVGSTVHRLALSLRSGLKVWGGGASIRRVTTLNGSWYFVNSATEDGSTFQAVFDIGKEYDAVWCYLQRMGGSGTVNIEEDES